MHCGASQSKHSLISRLSVGGLGTRLEQAVVGVSMQSLDWNKALYTVTSAA